MLTSQCLLGLATCYVQLSILKEQGTFLTLNDSGLLVFETPKKVVALEAISLGLAACAVDLFFWMAPRGGHWQVWASLALAFLLLERYLSGVYGPKRIEIDTQTGKYRRQNGWIKRIKTGTNADITGVLVEIDKPQNRIGCKLSWATGRPTTIGEWSYGVETKKEAADLAELMRQTINVPVSVREDGKSEPTK